VVRVNIDLTIQNITEQNKREKLINMSKMLSHTLSIPLEINGGGIIEKAKLHKYIRKEFINGKWYYKYEENKKSIEGKVLVCSSKPLKVTQENAKKVGEAFIKEWQKDWQKHPEKRKCPTLNYTKIGFADISIKHLSVRGKNKPRKQTEIMERTSLLPFAKEILEGKNKGIVSTVRNDEKTGLVYYEILGQAVINSKKETISVIVSKIKPDIKKYISVIKKALIKTGLYESLSRQDSSMLQSTSATDYHATNTSITNTRNKNNWWMSIIKKALSKILHGKGGVKAMDDGGQRYINRKNGQAMQNKSEAFFLQVGPSLPNIATKTTELQTDTNIINNKTHSVNSYPNIDLTIQNITEQNKREKLTKALKAVSKQLNLPIGIEEAGAKNKSSMYLSQENLLSEWGAWYEKILKEVYIAVTKVFGLPSIYSYENIEKNTSPLTIQKSIQDEKRGVVEPLIYKGKVVYSPETGKPIAKKDFEKFIKTLDAFLESQTKRGYKRIILDSIAIGKILNRLLKTHTLERVRKMRLEELELNAKRFGWIREEYKNLETTLKKPLTENEKARYQVCEDYATSLITKVNDGVRQEIKEGLLLGIRDRKSKSEISSLLYDKMRGHNRNWKRIVETESVNISNLASILEDVQEAKEGEKVYFKRYEMGDACASCKAIDGLIALWVTKPLENDKIEDENASIALWEGKASDLKKGIVGTGTMHPHCRGTWIKHDVDSL